MKLADHLTFISNPVEAVQRALGTPAPECSPFRSRSSRADAAAGEFDQLPQNDDAADPAAKLFQEVFDTREKVEQVGLGKGTALFRDLANGRVVLRKIPLLNDADVNAIFSGSLVRFRCMIQDNSLDQQIYQQYYLVEDPATGATVGFARRHNID